MLRFVTTDTPARRLAEHLLAQPLEAWVEPRRERGDSWRRIADELTEVTNGRVEIVGETLRGWFVRPALDDEDEEAMAS
jgi:hypothetical protein